LRLNGLGSEGVRISWPRLWATEEISKQFRAGLRELKQCAPRCIVRKHTQSILYSSGPIGKTI
jgi:hypothetical protein